MATETAPAAAASAATNLTGAFDIEGDGTADFTDAGLSDEFNAAALDAQWVHEVNVSEGVINLFTKPAQSVWDLATRSGGQGALLIQTADTGTAVTTTDGGIGADFTLPEGDTVIACMDICVPGEPDADQFLFGISLNDDDTGPREGNFCYFALDWGQESTDNRIITFDGGDVLGEILGYGLPGRLYMRIDRLAGDVYHFHVTVNGVTWSGVGQKTSALFDNFWIFWNNRASAAGINDPTSAFLWIRHFTGAAAQKLDPPFGVQ